MILCIIDDMRMALFAQSLSGEYTHRQSHMHLHIVWWWHAIRSRAEVRAPVPHHLATPDCPVIAAPSRAPKGTSGDLRKVIMHGLPREGRGTIEPGATRMISVPGGVGPWIFAWGTRDAVRSHTAVGGRIWMNTVVSRSATIAVRDGGVSDACPTVRHPSFSRRSNQFSQHISP